MLRTAVCAATLLLVPTAHAQWAGYVEAGDELMTDSYSFSGSRPGQVNSNENYYDGDFADFDGDGLPDRALGSRYGLLHNTGGGLMTPYAGYTDFLLRGMPGASGWGEDAFQWADVDGDGDLDNFSGGNGEPLTLQLNEAGRFRVAWQERVSALNIVNVDLDGDGDVDFATAHAFCSDDLCGHGCPGGGTDCEGAGWPRAFTLLVNQGDTSFDRVDSVDRGLPPASDLIMGLAAGDVDGDGDHDLVFINGKDRRVNLALNDGSGTFTTTSLDFGVPVREIGPLSGGFHQGMNLGDIDSDGDLDIVVALDRDVGTHPDVGHAVFVNDGAGFSESSATAFVVSGVDAILNGGNGKLVDADYDGDLDFVAYHREAGRLDFFENDGAGVFTYRADRSVDFGTGPIAIGNDTDIVDLDGDGSADLWVGSGGDRVRILLNSHAPADGLPADMPRDLTTRAADGGVELTWSAPAFGATARSYRVYRASSPGLHVTDRELVGVVGTPFQDEGLSDPITEPVVSFVDETAVPGATHFYSVVHVGTENDASAPTPERAGSIPGAESGAGPTIRIVSPSRQAWAAAPKIVVHFADGGSGVDPDSIRIAMDAPLGGGARPAGADLRDLAYRLDERAAIVALPNDLALPLDTLVTLSVSASDRDGNASSESVQFFVRVGSSAPPSASFTATPASGASPLPVRFDASASADADGRVFAWQWFFGDGSTGLGRLADHTYAAGGTFAVTLRVVDNEGGVSSTTQEITVSGDPAECAAGETRACYEGAAGTAGVGVCREGSEVCEGGRFGECAGAVVPGTERCGSGTDEDCDGAVDEGECSAATDGGETDGGPDRVPATGGDGCGCTAPGAEPAPPAFAALLLIGLVARLRRR